MDALARINATSHFGTEFLTWIWYQSATNNGIFTLRGGQVEIWLDTHLKLEIPNAGIKESNTIKCDAPGESKEAHVSLRTGKSASEAKLRVVKGQKQWTFLLKGTLQFSTLKLPALLSSEDDDRFDERMSLTTEIQGIVDELYERFIRLRVDADAWEIEVQAIRTWVHEVAA